MWMQWYCTTEEGWGMFNISLRKVSHGLSYFFGFVAYWTETNAHVTVCLYKMADITAETSEILLQIVVNELGDIIDTNYCDTVCDYLVLNRNRQVPHLG